MLNTLRNVLNPYLMPKSVALAVCVCVCVCVLVCVLYMGVHSCKGPWTLDLGPETETHLGLGWMAFGPRDGSHLGQGPNHI